LVAGNTYEFVWTITSVGCGIIDTDTVLVTVPGAGVVEAVMDTATVGFNEPSDIIVLANDTLNGYGVNVSIFKGPRNGEAVVNGDNSITYEPNREYLGEDEFIYQICMEACPNVCDTALVQLNVNYTFMVPDVITPDGDGVNDNFEIKGIDKYPRNELFIYNRWGNEIYHSVDYKNDWFGTYKGQPSPSGTYFYVLINRDNGRKLSVGYLTIHNE
jgi:gliding motility-associated-like protein